jgi:5'-nucleotidase
VKVLLTNDDGIYSPGLAALNEEFSRSHEVWILAPDGERSGYSNSITISEPIRVTKVDERTYASSGTPADCVILATRGAIEADIEVVISGINIGPNLGSDIVYSGTCAAARQAAYREIPGIAASLNSFHSPFHFQPVARFISENLDALLSLWNADHFINVNAPNLAEPRSVAITTPSMRRYDDHLLPFEPPRGGTYYFVDGAPAPAQIVEGTDWHAVEHGAISVSPIMLNPVNHAVEENYRAVSFVERR